MTQGVGTIEPLDATSETRSYSNLPSKQLSERDSLVVPDERRAGALVAILTILADYPNVDGVIAITHKTGCGIAWESADHRQLDRVLAGIARHPNVGGYILIGLGCETGNVRKGTIARFCPGWDATETASVS